MERNFQKAKLYRTRLLSIAAIVNEIKTFFGRFGNFLQFDYIFFPARIDYSMCLKSFNLKRGKFGNLRLPPPTADCAP